MKCHTFATKADEKATKNLNEQGLLKSLMRWVKLLITILSLSEMQEI